MKILITGGSGFLGYNLAKALSEAADVHYTSFQHPISIPGATERRVDLSDEAVPKALVEEVAPDLAFHAAGLTKVGLCEKDWHAAYTLNVRSTVNLAEALAERETPLVYFSTDLVFDGEKGNYREEDHAAPVSNYGWTKLIAETHVGRISHKNTVLRPALIYGWGPEDRHGFNGWMKEAFETGQRLNLFADEFRTPVYIGDIVKVCRKFLEAPHPGLFHVAGGERISRSHFGQKFAKTFGYDPDLIDAATIQDHKGPPRAPDCSLNIDQTVEEFGVEFLAVREGLEELKRDLG